MLINSIDIVYISASGVIEEAIKDETEMGKQVNVWNMLIDEIAINLMREEDLSFQLLQDADTVHK